MRTFAQINKAIPGVQERDLGGGICDTWGTTKSGPGGASTPLLRGLPINNLESR